MFYSILRIAFVLAVIATAWMHADVANANIVRDGLLSAWTFDRETIDEAGEDPIIKDVVGPFDGKIKNFRRDLGDQIKIVEGKFGEALMLGTKLTNGPVFVDLGRDIQKEMTKNFTLEGWFKFTALPEDWPKSVYPLWSSVDGSARNPGGMILEYVDKTPEVNDSFKLSWSVVSPLGTCTATAPFSLAGPQLNQWLHFGATYDESFTSRVYINGELQGETACEIKEVKESRQSLKLGFSTFHPYRRVDGAIDDARVYSRALTPKEMQKNFTDKVGLGVRPTRKLAVTWGQIKASKP